MYPDVSYVYPKCILDSFRIRVKYMQNVKIHVFFWNVTAHVRYVWDTSGYIRIHQDTCILQDTRKIHQDTYPIGNVPKKDRKCARSQISRGIGGEKEGDRPMSSRLVGNTALRLPAEQEHVPGCPRYSLLTRSC